MESTQVCWQDIAAKAQKSVLDSIPDIWRLPNEVLPKQSGANVINIPKTCGILTSKQLEITELTATELLAKIAKGELKAVEVTEAFCARAAIAHQLTNCLICFFPEDALKEAAVLDEYFEKTGQTIGPLHGLPIAIKDGYDVKGRVATMGYVSWHNVISEKDSTLVAELRKAGALIFAKNTMPQTGMVLETSSNLWGSTVNPTNTKLAAGGSSGGDAALVAMKGCPVTPGSDIGGSVRVPAAFNGLYSMRPSADRIPKGGMKTTAGGQNSIKVSCGPLCHSMDDVKMFTKILNAYPNSRYEPGVVPLPWKEIEAPKGKLSFGYMEFDGVCQPHPPILRAMRETAEKLVAAGHEVITIKLPLDCWKVALTTWKLYFQTGAVEAKEMIAAGGEEILPAFKYHLDVFGVKPLTATEIYALHREQGSYKSAMSDFWNSSSGLTITGRPFDGIITPVHPSMSFPHNFPCWWGYSSLWNILDYPSTTIPVKGFTISLENDAKDKNYVPLDNPFDRATYEMYDPELFASQSVSLQVVGRPFQDEEIISVSEVIDRVINP